MNSNQLKSKTFKKRVRYVQYRNKIEIKRILKSLPKEQANILRLLKIEGYSIKDISKAFHLNESSVKVRIHRIIKELKEKFGSQK